MILQMASRPSIAKWSGIYIVGLDVAKNRHLISTASKLRNGFLMHSEMQRALEYAGMRITTSQTLGAALRPARKRIGLTQSDLALAAGVGVRFIVDL
jgi:hypothetical protein